MPIDVTCISYSDALEYLQDYKSGESFYQLSEDEFYALSLMYDIESCIIINH